MSHGVACSKYMLLRKNSTLQSVQNTTEMANKRVLKVTDAATHCVCNIDGLTTERAPSGSEAQQSDQENLGGKCRKVFFS